MTWDSILVRLETEGQVLASAPVTFAAFLLFAFLLAWLLVRRAYRTRLSRLNRDLETARGFAASVEEKNKALYDLLSGVTKQLVVASDAKDPDGIFQNGRQVGQALRVKKLDDGILVDHLVATGNFNKDAPFLYEDSLLQYDSATTFSGKKQMEKGHQDFREAACSFLPRS